MKDWATGLYKSNKWKQTREAYARSVGGLCERCLAKGLYTPGEIVHHKIHLTPENIGDPAVSVSFDNLELLCRNCHADEHERTKKRYKIDQNGRVVTDPPLRGEI